MEKIIKCEIGLNEFSFFCRYGLKTEEQNGGSRKEKNKIELENCKKKLVEKPRRI